MSSKCNVNIFFRFQCKFWPQDSSDKKNVDNNESKSNKLSIKKELAIKSAVASELTN